MIASFTDRRTQVGMGIALVLVLLVGVASFGVIRLMIQANEDVRHTYEVLRELESSQSVLGEAESAQRGFFVTRNPAFLEPYQGIAAKALEHTDSVILLTGDNPVQQNTARRLKELTRERISRLSLLLDQFNQGYTDSMLDFNAGKRKMEEVRAVVNLMKQRENELMIRRERNVKLYATYAPLFIVLASLLSIGLTLYFYIRIRKESRGRAELLTQLQKQDAEIHARITAIKEVAGNIAGGDYTVRISGDKADDLGGLSEDLNRMSVSLDQSFREIKEREQHGNMVAAVSAVLVGEQKPQRLAARALEAIMRQSGATAGGLYIVADANAQNAASTTLQLAATIGSTAATLPRQVVPGDNLSGRAFQSGYIQSIRQDKDPVYETKTAAGPVANAEIAAIPVMFNGRPMAVVEVASPKPFGDAIYRFFKEATQSLGAALASALQQEQVQDLLHQTQAQSEELQAQQEELESINQELTVKAQALQSSEEELRVQQEELLQTNQELEERGQQLAERNQEVAERNENLQRASEAIRQSDQYKSDFLANMSHELRTPLNSVLLLSRLLASNSEGNLNEQQTEYARVIENSGNGLLRLIDELLDLSKIEAGKMEAEAEPVVLWDVMGAMESMFAPVAMGKGLNLSLNVEEGIPEVLHTDRLRLEQILRNLLSNALKFTEAGNVALTVSPSDGERIRITVTDTGIGIPASAQQYIFDAFRQADGSTQRKYGGTGLGLSISSRLAVLLGGSLTLESEPGKGSTFILTLPVRLDQTQAAPAAADQASARMTPQSRTSAANQRAMQPLGQNEGGRMTLLIVEDDIDFANALAGAAKKGGFRSRIINNGRDALAALELDRPAAVLLDLNLPDVEGLEVLRYVRTAPHLHGVPVHVLSGDLGALPAVSQQADSALAKPVSPHDLGQLFETIRAGMANPSGRLLIIEETREHARALELYLNDSGVQAVTAPDEAGAIAALRSSTPGTALCIVVPNPGGEDGELEMLRHIRETEGLADVPAIVVTARSKGTGATQQLAMSGATMVVKTAQAYKRIVDEAGAFLNLVRDDKPAANKTSPLAGRHILLADDDARNIYSLTRSLEAVGVRVTPALNGEEAVDACRQSPPDLVLMDIMMPVMDGYEATTAIRKLPGMRDLPIIAVTAKAMANDRAKCLEAGCNDYITKPVDVDQLLSLLRVWLSV